MIVEEGETSNGSNLFMARFETNLSGNIVWIVNSGCSNHMSGKRELFQDLDEFEKLKV